MTVARRHPVPPHTPSPFSPRCSLPHPASGFQPDSLHGVRTICQNPDATPAPGHGVRESLPPVCSIHGSLSSAAFLQAQATVLHKPTHFRCYFAAPYHCLEVPGDHSPYNTRVTSAPPQTPQSQRHGGSVAGPLDKNGLTLYISGTLTVPPLSQEKGTCMREITALGPGVLESQSFLFCFCFCADALVAWRQSSLLHRQVTGN